SLVFGPRRLRRKNSQNMKLAGVMRDVRGDCTSIAFHNKWGGKNKHGCADWGRQLRRCALVLLQTLRRPSYMEDLTLKPRVQTQPRAGSAHPIFTCCPAIC